nr:hypothetical protein [Bacillota bacterium]
MTPAGSSSMSAEPLVIIFDFDGTLYEAEEHFDTYADLLARSLDPGARQRMLEAWRRVRSGPHPLRVGRAYDPGRDWILDVSPADDRVLGVVTFDGTPVPEPRWCRAYDARDGAPGGGLPPGVIPVGDLWPLAVCLFLRFGGHPEAVDAAFRATRRYMLDGAFDPRPVPGIRQRLDDLRRQGHTLIMATNTPEPEAAPLLRRLGLDGAFDQVVYGARKPDGLRRLLLHLLEERGLPPQRIICVGDNYRNDVRPGWELACRTVFIDRYRQEAAPATVRVSGSQEALAWLAGAAAAPHRGRSSGGNSAGPV